MREVKFLVLHCSASPQTQTVEVIQDYWKRVLGWKTAGYHHLIRADGTVANLVPIEKPSNGVAGHNANSIHISYIGGVDKQGKPVDNRTDAQKKTMFELVNRYKKLFPKAQILGHRDFSPDKNRDGIVQPNEWMKSCPSFSAREWAKSMNLI